MGDLLSIRYASFLKHSFKEDLSVSIGYFQQYMPVFFKPLLNFFIKNILNHEMKAIKKTEDAIIRKASHVVLVNKNEAKKYSNSKKVSVIPFISNSPKKHFRILTKVEKKGYFIGNFNYFPNRLAINKIIELSFYPFQLDLLGANYSTDIVLKIKRNKSIQFIGEVKDLHQELSKYLFCYAPIYAGSGISSKIIEAEACGIPIITNPQGYTSIKNLS